ncbi:MAG TPA: membrane dipeptidase, partial [bacterium]
MSRREWLWAVAMASAASVMSGRAMAATPDPAVVQGILKGTPAVDVHTHVGGAIFAGKPSDSIGASIKAGGMGALCLASVPDGPVLGRDGSGKLAATRSPKFNELYFHHLAGMDWMDELVAKHGVQRVKTAAELRDAHAKGQPAVIQDIEGCDFLDGKMERLDEAYKRGVRVMQLVHYTPTPIGDFQTGDVRHNGLTD